MGTSKGNKNRAMYKDKKWKESISKSLKLHEIEISKNCLECGNEFKVKRKVGKNGEIRIPKKEKTYCGQSCSHKQGGKGKSNRLENENKLHYKSLCFKYHKHECIICGEKNIVAVHHMIKNSNNPKDLIPLCPTHHSYWHSNFKYLIEDKVKEYIGALA